MHHANIVIGKDCKDFILKILLEKLNFQTKANPDFLLIENLSLGIDDARNLERWVIGKPFLSDTKISLIIAKSITHEAQNALLKVLEEPPFGTYIFINLESLGGLLPTFLSRVRILNFTKETDVENLKSNQLKNADSFFRSGIKEKLSLISSLSKKEDKTPMKELLRDLESISYEYYKKTNDKNSSKAMKNILTAKIFASTRGSSPKMLLEWLACVL